MSKAAEIAQDILATAERLGWHVQVRGANVLTITKEFDGREGFVRADMEYGSILELAPGKGGSVWGTDGGGVGALAAMDNGVFRMNKSGVQKRVMNALGKALAR